MKKKHFVLAALAATIMAVPLGTGVLSKQVKAAGGVALDSSHFPDSGFREVLEDYDQNDDGYLNDIEIGTIGSLNFTLPQYSSITIRSLKGIEYLTALNYLECPDEEITELDLRGCPNLQYLYCDMNPLTSINVSGNPELLTITCQGTKITSLNLSACTKLTWLDCSYNTNLTSLDLRFNTKITNLFCGNCKLSSINISGLTALWEFDCNDNELTSLDLKTNTSLKYMICGNNRLTTLDLSRNTQLITLGCYMNKLVSLDLTNNKSLVCVDCSDNYLTDKTIFQVPSGCELKSSPQKTLAQVTNVKFTNITAESITVSWNKVADATGYEIYRSESANGTFTKVGKVSSNSLKNTGLNGSTTYYYKVRAIIERSGVTVTGKYSATGNATTAKPTPTPTLAPLKNLKVTEKAATSITLTWDSVAGATGYQVWRSTEKNGTYISLGTIDTTTKKSTGLTVNSVYYYKVRAVRDVNGKKDYGAYSSIVSARTLFTKVTGVKATAKSATSIEITWNAVADASGYQVWRATEKDGTYTNLGTYTDLSKMSTGLTANKVYYYKIRAVKEVDGTKYYGEYSAIVSARTQFTKVTGIKATAASKSSIKITWNAVDGATGYQVWRSTSKNGTYTSLGTYTDPVKVSTGLSANTTYYYKVRAVKVVDGTTYYGEYSAIVSAKTLAG